jgi:glutaredoxin
MKATIYSKPNCPYCVRAKMLLENRGAEITELSAVDQREQLIESVQGITGAPPKTVPQIWLDGEYVGGFQELDARLKNH